MKTTFTTVDIGAAIKELNQSIIGLRVNQIYDIDHKTYLIKLQKPELKVVLLLESAARIHITEYEWPKSPAPSGFSMKLRKHLRNKRLESIEQLGVDRIVDLTFGSAESTNHLILELYDRGNIILTDIDYNILNVLRPRKDGEDSRISVGEKYPVSSARQARDAPSIDELRRAISNAKANTPLKKVLNPLLDCGGGAVDSELQKIGLQGAKVGREVTADSSLENIHQAAVNAQLILQHRDEGSGKGYIIKKADQRPKGDGTSEEILLYQEFHPVLYSQHVNLPYEEMKSFNAACDEFFSNLESIQLDKKVLQKEKEVMKKLDNVRRDHQKRLTELKGKQELDCRKGQLIELNQQLVEGALLVIRSAIANQIDWRQIKELLGEAQVRQDPIACAIKDLKLEMNMFILWLSDPYDRDENDMLLDSDEEREEGTESCTTRPIPIDINIDQSALANARRYYNQKRQAAQKEQKTIDASFKAIKSAEKKTHQTLKEVSAVANINKARKVHWFEKYLWFISSENYLVIAGRDSQQNEQVVKRYLKPKDVYVHADLHGAASVVIKNITGGAVPPKTLHEAGIMALCYSRAWAEKVVTSAWWVHGHQVSKTAPTGEYLTTGAFMVRGKRNILPPSHLTFGFGLLFRLEESSIKRHEGERKTRSMDDGVSAALASVLEKLSTETYDENEQELILDDDDDDDHETGMAVTAEEEGKCEIVGDTKDEDTSDDDDVKSEGSNSDETESKVDVQQFPDTILEMSHLEGDQFTLKAKINPRSLNIKTEGDSKSILKGDEDQKGKKDYKAKSKVKFAPEMPVNKKEETDKAKETKGPPAFGTGPIKRGHKSKLKKMKKYKDQDDEDRELMKQLLQPDGVQKPKNKRKGRKGAGNKEKTTVPKAPRPAPTTLNEEKSKDENSGDPALPKDANIEDNDDEEDEKDKVPDDLSIIDALTAIPMAEDELLYAVPVCAPYNAMTNYKYKVKLTPGPGKKGKACKTALNLFMQDRTTSSREKDLLKAIKDYDMARNVPGKVKVSAPNISKVKK